MPEVQAGEKQSEYISRCVKHCIEQEGLGQNEALGKCYGLWKNSRKKLLKRIKTRKKTSQSQN